MFRRYILYVSALVWLLGACAPRPLPGTTEQVMAQPSETPTLPTQPAAVALPSATLPLADTTNEQVFDETLAQDFEARDVLALRALMVENFAFATFDTSLVVVSADEAVAQFVTNYLTEGSKPQVQFSSDIPALLGGRDPLGEWGPVANPVRALHITGLGARAEMEAIAVIGQDPSSEKLYFHGLLVPQQARFEIVESNAETALPTDVQSLRILADVNLRSGPGTQYDLLGLLSAGNIVQVSGISAEGDWWRIYCTDVPSGLCWVTADPTVTEALRP